MILAARRARDRGAGSHRRCAPRRAPSATELTALWQGDVLEVRGERAGYLKVYDYRRERGGYVRSEAAARAGARPQSDAPELLAVLRFLRDSPGSEALGISYGAAYLKAVPARALTAEPFDAIGAHGRAPRRSGLGQAARPLTSPRTWRWSSSSACACAASSATAACRSATTASCSAACWRCRRRVPRSARRAALGLTRPDCIDPALRAAAHAPRSTRSGAGSWSRSMTGT